MESANTGRVRLVRCPKCYNVLPEPPNVSVYKCGGCNTTLKAKVRVSNGENVVKKQVQQNSDSYSVVTSVGNEAPPRNKEPGLTGVTVNSSRTPDAPSTGIDHEPDATRRNGNDDATSDENKVADVANTENKEDCHLDGQDTNGRKMEAPTELIRSDCVTHVDSDKEDHTVEPSSENSEACRIREEDDMKSNQNNSKHRMHVPPAGRNLAESFPDSEQNTACETESDDATKISKLVKVQSRSCGLREGPRSSSGSLDFHSSRTSFRSKSFRASAPLESKIMKTVDDLRGDLYDIFSKPSDSSKPRALLPPRPLKRDGLYRPHAAIASSQPLTAYHPAAKHSGHPSRLSRSGQVAPHELPHYQRRRGAHSYCHSGQMETRPCSHECCHGYRLPPCCGSWKQEAALQKPPGKEMNRRPAPRNLCRPVLRGAPFVLCSNCLKLVQLPTEFAVPSRRTRRLQCGSCAEILSYSYRDRSRKKPQSPFEGDEYSIGDGHHNTTGGAAHQVDSEEYGGLSGGTSYSTEDEQPLHVSRNSSFDTSGGSSARESKLHRLMGYTSASELLWQHSPDLYESFSRRTPADPKGKGICVTDDDGSGGEEERSAVRKSKARGGGLPFHGMLKRGIHGLESLKLRS